MVGYIQNKLRKVIKLLRYKFNFLMGKPNGKLCTIWQWDSHKKIDIIGMSGDNFLAENMVYDPTTEKYYIIFTDANTDSIGLIYTYTPKDEKSWHYGGKIITGGVAPCILLHENTWYVFYSDREEKPYSIAVRTSPSIFGPYDEKIILLRPENEWEKLRLDEPFVIFDGVWRMLFMGDSGNFTEQIGYAESENILGPYVKRPEPVIKFGKSYDKGTVADPWAMKENGIWHIGYACSRTKSKPWRTALALTIDFVTFEKKGVILNLGHGWNNSCAFRGALTKIGDTWYFPYTGRSKGTYKIGIAIKQ